MTETFRNYNHGTAWYVAVVMACGFITFYSLPDAVPFLVRLTTIMLLVQEITGVLLGVPRKTGRFGPF